LNLVLLGVFLSLMLELCGVSSLPFAVGVYLPISTSAPIFVGGAARHWLERRKRQAAEGEFSPGTLLSSGYIAGGAIAGVGLALLALPEGGAWLEALDLGSRLGPLSEGPRASLWASSLWALAWFGLLVALLIRTAGRDESGQRR
jgi:hypothetical protein